VPHEAFGAFDETKQGRQVYYGVKQEKSQEIAVLQHYSKNYVI